MTHHYLRINYPDGSFSHERIAAMNEDGLTIIRHGVPLFLTADLLDELECYVDGYGKWLIRPWRAGYAEIRRKLKQKGPRRMKSHASQTKKTHCQYTLTAPSNQGQNGGHQFERCQQLLP